MPDHTITPEMENLLLTALAESLDGRATTKDLIPIVEGSSLIDVDKSSPKSLHDTIRWALISMCDNDTWVHRPFGKIDSEQRRERKNWIQSNRPQQSASQQVWEITENGRLRFLPKSNSVPPYAQPTTQSFLPDLETEPAQQSTFDTQELEKRVQLLLRSTSFERPKGNAQPRYRRAEQAPLIYERSPAVKAWVLRQAAGVCECCGKPGPFLLPDGTCYLEVHHVKHLAQNGPDTIENTIAVCPNCHRHLHLGIDSGEMREQLYLNVPRLQEI